MSRRTLVFGSILILLLVAIVASAIHDQLERSELEEQARIEQDRDREREAAEEEARMQMLAEASGPLVPDALQGVTLGMSEQALREARSGAGPSDNPGGGDDVRLLEEQLENGAQVMYSIGLESDRLERIQVLSVLPSADAFEAHLRAMIDEYESPTGIWDCPDTGGVPTRRFTWRRGNVTVVDIFLVYGNRISVTLDIAPSETIAESLRMARCYPVTRDNLDEFPTTTLRDITRGTVEADGPTPPSKTLSTDRRAP